MPVGYALAGKTMGVIGLGRLGSHMARYCKALNMNLLAWSQNLTPDKAQAAGATMVSKEELLSRSDAVSIHLVLSDRTRGLIGAADIARMKPGAILVNTSRGPIVDEKALIEAVQARQASSRRWMCSTASRCRRTIRCARAPNVVMTPHLGYGVQETWVRLLSAERGERAGVSRRQAGAGDQSRGAGES